MRLSPPSTAEFCSRRRCLSTRSFCGGTRALSGKIARASLSPAVRYFASLCSQTRQKNYAYFYTAVQENDSLLSHKIASTAVQTKERFASGAYMLPPAEIFPPTHVSLEDGLVAFSRECYPPVLCKLTTSLRLLTPHPARLPPTPLFCCCAGDWDLKTMLPGQCKLISTGVPAHFRAWANIKRVFQVSRSGEGTQTTYSELNGYYLLLDY